MTQVNRYARRTYLDEDADLIRSLLSPEATPPEGSHRLFILYAVLMRAKGVNTTLSDVHDAWAAWKQGNDPLHFCLIPFADLDDETQSLDVPYLQAIHAAAREQSRIS